MAWERPMKISAPVWMATTALVMVVLALAVMIRRRTMERAAVQMVVIQLRCPPTKISWSKCRYLPSSDFYGPDAVHPDRPLYEVTREEDINIGNGDSIVPQVPPPACAGALHTVDLAGSGADNYGEVVGTGYDVNGVPVGVTVPASSPTDNPTFVDIGGTIYEGEQKPLCDMKLVHLADRKSIAPGFQPLY